MSDFVNTVDQIGDEALTKSIIDRSIAEIADDRVAEVGAQAFACCIALTKVNFRAATRIAYQAFLQCAALTTADFSAATSLENYSLAACSSLTALILRSSTVATLADIGAFVSTPIKSGTGYIYVPAALVDSYKAADNWSTFANQFRAIESYTVDGTTTGELDETKI